MEELCKECTLYVLLTELLKLRPPATSSTYMLDVFNLSMYLNVNGDIATTGRTISVFVATGLYTKALGGIELISTDSVMTVPFSSAEAPRTIAKPTIRQSVVLISPEGI